MIPHTYTTSKDHPNVFVSQVLFDLSTILRYSVFNHIGLFSLADSTGVSPIAAAVPL